MNQNKFAAERRRGLGATDSPAILGISPWRTPLDVYAEKVGATPAPSLEENEAIEWGHLLEPYVAKKYLRTHPAQRLVAGRRYRVCERQSILICHLDRLLEDPGRGLGVLEVKNVGQFKAGEWKEDAPLHYQVQLQHQLLVTGLEWGVLAALIGGQRFVCYEFARKEAFCELLTEKAEAFWRDHVLARRPPPVLLPRDLESIKRLYPTSNGKTIELPPEAAKWDEELQMVKEQLDFLKGKEDLLKGKLLEALGPAELGLLPGGELAYSAKLQRRAAYEVQATEFRTLRRINVHARKTTGRANTAAAD